MNNRSGSVTPPLEVSVVVAVVAVVVVALNPSQLKDSLSIGGLRYAWLFND